jgi:hypothetical protein
MDTNTLFLLLPSTTPPSSPESEQETHAHGGEKIKNERVEEESVTTESGGGNTLGTGQLLFTI